jgi:hypothetical protein
MGLDVHKLRRGEMIATLGAAVLAIAVFLPWYHTNETNASINGLQGHISAWDAHSIVRFLLLAAALAPLILAYIIVRDLALSWPRGELTAVVSIAALGLILYFGLIDRPGNLRAGISLDYGWYVALVAGGLMLYGAAARSSEQAPARKPPGAL